MLLPQICFFLLFVQSQLAINIKLTTSGKLFPEKKNYYLPTFNFTHTVETQDPNYDAFFGSLPIFPFTLQSILYINTLDFQEVVDSSSLLNNIIECYENNLQKFFELPERGLDGLSSWRPLFLVQEQAFSSPKAAMTIISPEGGLSIKNVDEDPISVLRQELFRKGLIHENGILFTYMDKEIEEKIKAETKVFLNGLVDKDKCIKYEQTFKDSVIELRISSSLKKGKIEDFAVLELHSLLGVTICSKFSTNLRERLKRDVEAALKEFDDNEFHRYVEKKKLNTFLEQSINNAGVCFSFHKYANLKREVSENGEINYNLAFEDETGPNPQGLRFSLFEDIGLLKQNSPPTRGYRNSHWLKSPKIKYFEFLKPAFPAFYDHFGIENKVDERETFDDELEAEKEYNFELKESLDGFREGIPKISEEEEIARILKYDFYYNVYTKETLFEIYNEFANEKGIGNAREESDKLFETAYEKENPAEAKTEFVRINAVKYKNYRFRSNDSIESYINEREGRCFEAYLLSRKMIEDYRRSSTRDPGVNTYDGGENIEGGEGVGEEDEGVETGSNIKSILILVILVITFFIAMISICNLLGKTRYRSLDRDYGHVDLEEEMSHISE